MNLQTERLAPQAYEQILDLILSGKVRPAEHLNERKLAELIGVSRTPIRDALLKLETEGLLVRNGRMGVQIKHMNIDEFLDALEVRTLLEPTMSRKAAGKISPSLLNELESLLQNALSQYDASGSGIDRKDSRWIDDRLHGLISEASGNSQLSLIIRNLRRKTQIFDLKNIPERAIATCTEHLEIIDALRLSKGDRAADKMFIHLENIRDSIIERLAGS